MKTMRYMTALLAMGAIAAACSVKTTNTDDDGDGGTGGTGATVVSSSISSTVASSTVASSTVTSTVASSSSGGMDLSPICDSGFALGGGATNKPCADCLGMNCCTEYTTCFADQDCQDCFIVQQGTGTSCDAGTLDEAVTSCGEGACASECGG